MKLLPSFIIFCLCMTFIVSCSNNNSDEDEICEDIIAVDVDEEYPDLEAIPEEWYALPPFMNHVLGHDERDTIVGNFTGKGMDTLYIVMREVTGDDDDLGLGVKFYAVSNNKHIPEIELFGDPADPPKIVFEGDVDGDGRDEWGYLHTWMMSQYRLYHVYNYNPQNKKWRHLFYDTYPESQFLETSESFRSMGYDIVEKGPRPGLIKINYMTRVMLGELKDTIIAPTYTPISNECW